MPGPPYTLEEDKKILMYMLDKHYVSWSMGNLVWIELEELDLLPGRSWQSMKNRWRRGIVLDLARPEYELTPDERLTIKSLLENVSKVATNKKRMVNPRNSQPKSRNTESRNTEQGKRNAESDHNEPTTSKGKTSWDKYYSLDMSSSSDTE